MAGLSSTVPYPFNSFIGRAEELQTVQTLLAKYRLVTLTGAAGIGKTRLALQAAAELTPFYADGVCFVGLVELTDPTLLPQAVASALGVREPPDGSLQQALTDILASRAVLLVWDNCDYVAEGCRGLAQALLGACSQVKILATSRRSLRVHGEALYALPPFSFPEARFAQAVGQDAAEMILAYEAPRLFQERAGEVLTGYTIRREDAAAVAQICRRLDGIPLAVELAAGRIRELSAPQIAARLDERFHLLTGGASSITHQQTLRAAIEWSNELLSPAEQTLLARLSVFAGGWDLEAAEQVCSDDILRSAYYVGDDVSLRTTHYAIRATDVLDLLTGLIDKSWVVGETTTRAAGGRRYQLLETLRDYGQERLKASGDEAKLRARHAEFYLKLAEQAAAELRWSVPATWLDRLESEYENLRAALAWCLRAVDSGQRLVDSPTVRDSRTDVPLPEPTADHYPLTTAAEMGLRLARALAQFWEVRGYLSEGRAYLAAALGREGAGEPTRERADALNAAAVLAWMQGDVRASRALFDESLAIERTFGDSQGVAWSIHHLGHVAAEQGDYETAQGLYEESLAIFRELEYPPGVAASLADQGNMALKQGDLEAARSLYEESLRISRQLENKISIAIALNNLGKIAREQGDARAAWALHTESLTIRLELGDKGGYPWSLEAFARLAAPQGPERAARLWGAAEALRESLGWPLPPNEREEYERHRSAAREALGEARFAVAWAEGRGMKPEQAAEYALRDDEESGPALGRLAGEGPALDGPKRAETPAAVPARPLPQPLTPFFGREAEVGQVSALLLPRDEGYTRFAGTRMRDERGAAGPHPSSLTPHPCRLVTLTGLGGTGKTRLALEVARRVQEQGTEWAGVGFVSLADLTDPRLIHSKIREALNLPEAGAVDPLDQIAAHLADQPFLLVLDNFEQLVPDGAATLQELMDRAPGLVCMVTTRRPLGLAAEEEFPVAPLPVPVDGSWLMVDGPAKAGPSDQSAINHQLSTLTACPSVRLFVSRAQAARPEFQVTPANAAAVAEVCRALEGIPLALELAAARAPVLTPAQMLQHLSDRFSFLAGHSQGVAQARHTLRAALEWSYQSLPESRQRLLSRLSVFRGGWTLEAAEAVAGVGRWALGVGEDQGPPIAAATPNAQRPTPLLDAMMDLQNASLVHTEEVGEVMRFRMLETVREYAEERLTKSGEAEAVQARHRDWHLGLAERAERELDGPASALWLDRLEAERENLRAALAWCLRAVDSGQWLVDSPAQSGAIPELSSSAPTTNHQPLTTHVEAGLRLAGALGRFWEVCGYTNEGRSVLAAVLAREAGAGARSAGYPAKLGVVPGGRDGERARGRAKALMWAGVLAHGQAEYQTARAQYEESLALYQQWEDRASVAAVLYRLGNLTGEQADYAEALRFHEESLSIRRALGDPVGMAQSLNCLGNLALDQGDYGAARSRYEESLVLSRERGDRRGWCWSRHFLGVVAEHEGDFALARSIYEECLPVWRELRSQVQVAWALHGIGYAAYRQGDFPAARSRLAESLSLFSEMDYTGGLVRTLERLGGLAVARGERERAVRLLAAAASQRVATGARTALTPPEEYDRDVAAVRAGLDADAFEAAWAEGQAMTLQQAIEYALQRDEKVESDRGPGDVRPPVLPLLATKLALPALSPGLLPRPRLTARLNPTPSSGARAARLALLDASPGSGKSSLVSQWCHQQREGSVAWLSLDREDNDPARFLRYLCAALETVAPAAAARVRALLQAAERPPLEHALTLLLNGVAALEQPVTLALDDYHEIEAAPVHDLVTFLVEHLPPILFLILTTRSDPPLLLARLRMQGQLIEIRDDELRFTLEEATQFLNQGMGLALPPELAQRLAERTEGWIAGLQMAALSLQSESDPRRFIETFAGTHRYLGDYLCEEVVQRQPPAVQAFLGKTAFLDRLCGPLCDAVTGTPGGQAMLQRLAAAHLFLIPLDQEQHWYRYHPLFADVLRARLLPSDAEEIAALHGRAAAWYEEQGMVHETIEHALAGVQLERAARLIERHGASEPVIARLEQLLEKWLKQGREARTLDARVLLAKLYWQAGRREQAIVVLQPALASPRAAGPSGGIEQEEQTRRFVAVGPALIPALRQAAVQGIAPETVGRLLTALGEAGASPVSVRAGAPSGGSSSALPEPLSERELEVLRLVAAGLSNAEIAEQLFLAVGTVKRHVFNLYGKLGANSRTSAVARASELGLL